LTGIGGEGKVRRHDSGHGPERLHGRRARYAIGRVGDMAGVYLESTVISYLAARPSRDLIVAAHQRLTQDWWTQRRHGFELFVSSLVIQEIGMGDSGAAVRRMDLVAGIPLLEVGDAELELVGTLIRDGVFPAGSDADALHVAIAAANGLDYLLTWNMAHIANAELRPKIERACRRSGYEPPVLCTPAELMGG
jgi:hypothetical protein